MSLTKKEFICELLDLRVQELILSFNHYDNSADYQKVRETFLHDRLDSDNDDDLHKDHGMANMVIWFGL